MAFTMNPVIYPTVNTRIVYHRHPNDSCMLYAPSDKLPDPYRLIFGLAIIITAFIAFLLNLFVIITLIINYRHQRANQSSNSNNSNSSTKVDNRIQLRTSYSNTHQSFISLSISVITYSSICVPGMYLKTIDNFTSNEFIIKVLIFSFYVSPIASSFMHLLMAFDRYLAIKQCFNFHRYWYRRHYTLCIVLLWITSILIIVPFFWYRHYSKTGRIVLTLLRLLFTFSIPSLLTLVLYLKIVCELVKVKKSELKTLMKSKNVIAKHRKIIVKIIILAITHFLCWFPFSVVESLNDLFPDLFHLCSTDIHVEIYYRLYAVLILITSMSGIAYPILYCFVSNEFRKLFKHLLWTCWTFKSAYSESNSFHSDHSSVTIALRLSNQQTFMETSNL